ncbi:hypothetical protein SAMN06297422_10845 [Lachnospiraceae bacterium]|nr:hypothetical protein SAMN06297422_10845 [Lachnospiraceae bacterium]
MRKFNLVNAYATLRSALLRLVNGLNFVCEFPGFKA